MPLMCDNKEKPKIAYISFQWKMFNLNLILKQRSDKSKLRSILQNLVWMFIVMVDPKKAEKQV